MENPLGVPRRTRSIDEKRTVVQISGAAPARSPRSCRTRGTLTENPFKKGVVKDKPGLQIFTDELFPLDRLPRLDSCKDGSRFPDPEKAGVMECAPGNFYKDHFFGTNVLIFEVVKDPPRKGVQFGVGKGLFCIRHGNGIGHSLHILEKSFKKVHHGVLLWIFAPGNTSENNNLMLSRVTFLRHL